MTQTIRRNDKELQASVAEELSYNPSVDAAHLVVSANDGVVTLSGDVTSLPERHAAKRAAMRVSGVKALADDMVVRNPGASGTKDSDLAESANRMLKAAVDVPVDKVKASVRDHAVTLSGTVTWQFQRQAAARAVMYLRGVTAVANAISLASTAPVSEMKSAIEAAVARNSQLDFHKITVDVDGGEVTLRGTVRSCAERRQAEYVAWSAAGVTRVSNDLAVIS